MVASEVMALVDEIRRRRLSRNKHFTLFTRREYREARRIQRYLDGLAAELTTLADEGELDLGLETETDGRLVLTVEVARLGLRRRCYLSREELDYLADHHAEVAQHIADATGLPLRCGVTPNPRIETQGDDRDV
jgi:hypothetical protein